MTMENRFLIPAGGLENYLTKLVNRRDQCLGEYTLKQQALADVASHEEFRTKMEEVRQLGVELTDLNERIDDTREEMKRNGQG
jgi:hypothetical protein